MKEIRQMEGYSSYGEWLRNGHHEWWRGVKMIGGGMNHAAQILIAELQTVFGDEEVKVAGGYARDLHYGRKSNDIDIFVHLGHDYGHSEAFKEAEWICRVARNRGFTVEVSQAYELEAEHPDGIDECTFSARHWAIAQLEFGDLSIDVLFTKSEDIFETLRTFDVNLNQAYLRDGTAVWPYGIPTELKQLKELPPGRAEKMQGIAREVGLK